MRWYGDYDQPAPEPRRSRAPRITKGGEDMADGQGVPHVIVDNSGAIGESVASAYALGERQRKWVHEAVSGSSPSDLAKNLDALREQLAKDTADAQGVPQVTEVDVVAFLGQVQG